MYPSATRERETLEKLRSVVLDDGGWGQSKDVLKVASEVLVARTTNINCGGGRAPTFALRKRSGGVLDAIQNYFQAWLR